VDDDDHINDHENGNHEGTNLDIGGSKRCNVDDNDNFDVDASAVARLVSTWETLLKGKVQYT
jgi:hypothetical protein